MKVMMNRSRKAAAWFIALSAAVPFTILAGGCGPQPAPPSPGAQAGDVTLDACALRLHDLCGELLLYYAAHKELPQALDEIGSSGAPVVCPTTNKPYVYDRVGLVVPGWPGRLIVYEPQPSRPGVRWAILSEPPQPGKPLVVRVVPAPEGVFTRQAVGR
jgi:hypothetical protein